MKDVFKDAFKCFLIIMAISGFFMIIGALSKDHSSSTTHARTCAKPGCDIKCDSGQIYCFKHRTYSTPSQHKKENTQKRNNTDTHRKLTDKSYYTDEMPDPDDYDNWGDFMDDWDGNMPDGSDASDYYDNW